jgi:hypothetical protein
MQSRELRFSMLPPFETQNGGQNAREKRRSHQPNKNSCGLTILLFQPDFTG